MLVSGPWFLVLGFRCQGLSILDFRFRISDLKTWLKARGAWIMLQAEAIDFPVLLS
jgi:hypothetical protein